MDRELIVSLTSYPARIKSVCAAVESLVDQTYKADRIVLWLAKSDFRPLAKGKRLKSLLPNELLALVKAGQLEIHWSKDTLKPHDKYYWSMRKWPKADIITVDDDLLQPDDLIETLVTTHKKFPQAIVGVRTHQIVLDRFGEIAPYAKWKHTQRRFIEEPKMCLLATGGAGTLYPAGLIDVKSFDMDEIKNVALTVDDLYLKTIEALQQIPVVQAPWTKGLTFVNEETQKTALFNENSLPEGNDAKFQALLEAHPRLQLILKDAVRYHV